MYIKPGCGHGFWLLLAVEDLVDKGKKGRVSRIRVERLTRDVKLNAEDTQVA